MCVQCMYAMSAWAKTETLHEAWLPKEEHGPSQTPAGDETQHVPTQTPMGDEYQHVPTQTPMGDETQHVQQLDDDPQEGASGTTHKAIAAASSPQRAGNKRQHSPSPPNNASESCHESSTARKARLHLGNGLSIGTSSCGNKRQHSQSPPRGASDSRHESSTAKKACLHAGRGLSISTSGCGSTSDLQQQWQHRQQLH